MTARHASDEADDAALATAVAAGDVNALGEIYDRYAGRLLGFCRSILHNQAEAEDCLQDVFVIAATRLSGLREPALLRSWLFSVARHECLARIDKRKREVLVDEVADRPSFDQDPSSSAAVDAELAALLRDAQAGLSDRDRLLLELADRQQLAGEEFAAAVGVTALDGLHAVGSRSHHREEVDRRAARRPDRARAMRRARHACSPVGTAS